MEVELSEQRRLQLKRIKDGSPALEYLTIEELDQQLREPFTSSNEQAAAIYTEQPEYRAAISSIKFDKPVIWKNYIHTFDESEITSLHVAFQYSSSFSLLKFLAFLCSCVRHSTKPLKMTLAISIKAKLDADYDYDVANAIDQATAKLGDLLRNRESLSLKLTHVGRESVSNDDVDAFVTALARFMLRHNRIADTLALHRPGPTWIQAFREACKANPVSQWQATLHVEGSAKVIASVLSGIPAGMTLRSLILDIKSLISATVNHDLRGCLRKLLKAGSSVECTIMNRSTDLEVVDILPLVKYHHLKGGPETRFGSTMSAEGITVCVGLPSCDVDVLRILPASDREYAFANSTAELFLGQNPGGSEPSRGIRALHINSYNTPDVQQADLANLRRLCPQLVELKLHVQNGCYGGPLCNERRFQAKAGPDNHYPTLLVGKQQVAALTLATELVGMHLPNELLTKLLQIVLWVERLGCYTDFQ
eukprot:m.69126 g.69126  ORF g.69126 m.69126 type:complete len:479 (+) comp14107_c0_seq8:397-1833(+)